MGIEALEQHFEVRILDCTAWLMPRAFSTRGQSKMTRQNLRRIGSLHELKDELRTRSGGIAIDYVGQFSIKAILLFYLLKDRGIRLVVLDSGAVPPPKVATRTGSLWAMILFAMRSKAFQRHATSLLIKLLLKCLPDQSADYALVAGTSWERNPRFSRARIKIPAHSFDYEKFLQVRKLPEQRNYDYAVYLDEDIAGHEDNLELGLGHPVSERRFYETLSRFFGRFEAVSGMPVLVAGYPSERVRRLEHFGGREFVRGETAQLIRNAEVVFAHGSTSSSYAVMWRRPIVFLTSDEMTASWYYPTIDARARSLHCPIVSIDHEQEQLDIVEWQKMDQGAYNLYEETYIKSKNSPEVSLWEIFLNIRPAADV